jgi:hypothetical protein
MNINHDQEEIDPKLAERFSRLQVTPPRDTDRATAGRAAFLSQARNLAQKNPPTVPVSPPPRVRLIEWMQSIPSTFTRKERQPMFTKVMAVIIAVVLVFSGAAVTAYASQASLPTDALYGVKTFGENIRISLAPQADSKLGLALEFTQRRVDEMAALNQLGMTIPAHVASQYQEQVEYTLRLAAGLSDDDITPALEQIHSRLQEQLRTLDQLHQANPGDPALNQAREQLRQQLHLVETGLQDPQQFREQMRLRERLVQQTQAPSRTEAPDPTLIPGAANNNANGNGNGNLNGNENGNANGNMNGNGNEDANGNMNGNGNEDANGNGNGNEDADDNMNGNGNGNGNDDSGHDDGAGGDGNVNDDDHSGNGNDGGGGNDNDHGDDKGGSGGGNDNDHDDDKGGGGGGNDNDNGGSGGGHG